MEFLIFNVIMDIKKVNETFDRMSKSGLFGKIQEEVFDIKSKLTSLLKSGTPDNIELAIMVAQGQEFDIDDLVEELFDLQIWMDNLDGIPRTSKVEALRFLLSKTIINLYSKGLSELSESIGNLQHLQELYLYNNNLSSLPESIGNLQNLQELYLEDNNLSSLPESIGNLQNLEWLRLYNNNLSSLPESIVNLQNLKGLYLSGNTIPTNVIKRLKVMLPNCEVEF